MITSMLLQITTRNVFDPLVILFFCGSALFLYGTWVVLRNPSSDGDDLPPKPARSRDPRSSKPAPRKGRRDGIPK